MKDNLRHVGLRNQLVEQLAQKGIKDKNVLKAIAKVPRHWFLDSTFENFAYQDKAFPIGANQTISQPYTVAFQTELLELKKGEKVLEVGTGSGYQTAVLYHMGVKVYSIERQKELYNKTSLFLPKIGVRVKFFFGDGYKGQPKFAPYDKILVTAGAPQMPKVLLAQLKVGGTMVIPIGDKEQVMMKLIRKNETQFEKSTHGLFRFVPLLRDKN